MAFTIMLQISYSEKNRLDKQVSDVLVISGTLKAETSLINPVVVCAVDLSSIADVNYMTIPAFGRKYFVTDIRSIRDGFCEITAHVDVLSTYRDQIRNNTAIISKQEHDWNLYLNDGSLQIYQNSIVLTKAFPSGFTTQEFVIAVAGS